MKGLTNPYMVVKKDGIREKFEPTETDELPKLARQRQSA